MAEKTIKTRIQERFATLEEWQTVWQTLVPLKGEVYKFQIPANEEVEGIQKSPDSRVLTKTGDGETLLIHLPWDSALCANEKELSETTAEADTATLSHGDKFITITDVEVSGHNITKVPTQFTLPEETKLTSNYRPHSRRVLYPGEEFTTVTSIAVSDHEITHTHTSYAIPERQQDTVTIDQSRIQSFLPLTDCEFMQDVSTDVTKNSGTLYDNYVVYHSFIDTQHNYNKTLEAEKYFTSWNKTYDGKLVLFETYTLEDEYIPEQYAYCGITEYEGEELDLWALQNPEKGEFCLLYTQRIVNSNIYAKEARYYVERVLTLDDQEQTLLVQRSILPTPSTRVVHRAPFFKELFDKKILENKTPQDINGDSGQLQCWAYYRRVVDTLNGIDNIEPFQEEFDEWRAGQDGSLSIHCQSLAYYYQYGGVAIYNSEEYDTWIQDGGSSNEFTSVLVYTDRVVNNTQQVEIINDYFIKDVETEGNLIKFFTEKQPEQTQETPVKVTTLSVGSSNLEHGQAFSVLTNGTKDATGSNTINLHRKNFILPEETAITTKHDVISSSSIHGIKTLTDVEFNSWVEWNVDGTIDDYLLYNVYMDGTEDAGFYTKEEESGRFTRWCRREDGALCLQDNYEDGPDTYVYCGIEEFEGEELDCWVLEGYEIDPQFKLYTQRIVDNDRYVTKVDMFVSGISSEGHRINFTVTPIPSETPISLNIVPYSTKIPKNVEFKSDVQTSDVGQFNNEYIMYKVFTDDGHTYSKEDINVTYSWYRRSDGALCLEDDCDEGIETYVYCGIEEFEGEELDCWIRDLDENDPTPLIKLYTARVVDNSEYTSNLDTFISDISVDNHSVTVTQTPFSEMIPPINVDNVSVDPVIDSDGCITVVNNISRSGVGPQNIRVATTRIPYDVSQNTLNSIEERLSSIETALEEIGSIDCLGTTLTPLTYTMSENGDGSVECILENVDILTEFEVNTAGQYDVTISRYDFNENNQSKCKITVSCIGDTPQFDDQYDATNRLSQIISISEYTPYGAFRKIYNALKHIAG